MILLGTLLSAVLSALLCPLVIRMLRRRSVIDAPVARSSHSLPTPRGGGIAPAIGACAGLALTIEGSTSILIVVAAAAVAYGVLGLVDDVADIAASNRLLIQVTIAAPAVVPLAWQITNGIVLVLLIPVVWLWLAAYVNAFNFMDGINGISATQVVVAGAAWGLVGLWRDEPALTAGGFVVAAAALAFLPFNFPRARVFMGDVGSYFFGGWLAAMTAVALGRSATIEMAGAPLLLYLCDTAITILRRLAQRVPITEAHREHTYQRLVIGGWSHGRTTAYVGAVIAMSSLLGAATMLGNLAVRVIADAALALLMLGYLMTPTWQGRRTGVEAAFPITQRRQ